MNAASASPPSPRQPRETRSIERISEMARWVIFDFPLLSPPRDDGRRRRVFLGRASRPARRDCVERDARAGARARLKSDEERRASALGYLCSSSHARASASVAMSPRLSESRTSASRSGLPDARSVRTHPTKTHTLFARVRATFSLRGSARNPTSPRALHRTALITTTSASEPWKASTVCTAGGGKCAARRSAGGFVCFSSPRRFRLVFFFAATEPFSEPATAFASDPRAASSRRTRRTCSL
mmetsp:Transcript_7253/g.30121  ORF Transcript_7253/g.30121 Transcript_7253/m.30121 type:complete len:242 (+) Transcript_7253:1995-2720(+)